MTWHRRIVRYFWTTPPQEQAARLLRSLRMHPITESERLARLPRYSETTTNLLGRSIGITDAASFLAAREEIFDWEIYRFPADRRRPFIIDCGANVGLSVIYLKNLHSDAEMVAFEPDEVLFQHLRSNVACFGFTDVDLHRAAVWTVNGTVDFLHDGADAGRINSADDHNGPVHPVPAVRLRDLLNRRVDLLKLDIEGAEVEVLCDCEDRLHKVERIFVEYHGFVHRRQRLAELLRVLDTAGFAIHITSHGVSSRQPFVRRETVGGMQFLLNIHAFRDGASRPDAGENSTSSNARPDPPEE